MNTPLATLFTLVALGTASVHAEPLWQRLLRISGITATPSQQKAPEELETGGELWIAHLESRELKKLPVEAGFRSPVFTARGDAVLAVKDDAVWQIATRGNASPRKLHTIPGVQKLVGFDSDNGDNLLVLLERENQPSVALLSLASGALTVLPYDAGSSDDRKALNHLKGWERTYGDTLLFLRSQTRRTGGGGEVEWNDVFLQRGDGAPVNVSRSGGTQCGQPSLSPDKKEVVFVKAADAPATHQSR